MPTPITTVFNYCKKCSCYRELPDTLHCQKCIKIYGLVLPKEPVSRTVPTGKPPAAKPSPKHRREYKPKPPAERDPRMVEEETMLKNWWDAHPILKTFWQRQAALDLGFTREQITVIARRLRRKGLDTNVRQQDTDQEILNHVTERPKTVDNIAKHLPHRHRDYVYQRLEKLVDVGTVQKLSQARNQPTYYYRK